MIKTLFPFFLAGALCLSGTAFAQTAELDNIGEVVSGRISPIKSNNAVVGYAFVYKMDDNKSGTNYRLQLLDENLKTIGSSEFEAEKSATLADALYEAGTVALVFEDKGGMRGIPEQYMKTFNIETKAATTVRYERDEDDKNTGLLGRAMAQGANGMHNQFTSLDGLGFLTVYTSQNRNGGIGIQMVGTDGKRKWRKKLMGNEEARLDAHLLGTAQKTVLFFGGTRSGFASRDSKNFLIGLDGNTGQPLFRKSLEANGIASEPVFIKNLPDGRVLICNMLSDAADNFYTARHTGFNYGFLDPQTGEMTGVKTIDYAKDLAAVVKMKNETKTDEGFMHISNMIPMPDNSMVVVGEFFRRTASAGGIATSILSVGGGGMSSNNMVQGTIGDMFMLRVNADGTLAGMEQVEKKTSRVSGAQTGSSIAMMGRMMEAMGAFDYRFTDELEDNRKIVVIDGSLNGKSEGISAISLSPGKGYEVKNLTPVEAERNEAYFVAPGKPGHALVMKLNKKSKRASLQIQRLD